MRASTWTPSWEAQWLAISITIMWGPFLGGEGGNYIQAKAHRLPPRTPPILPSWFPFVNVFPARNAMCFRDLEPAAHQAEATALGPADRAGLHRPREDAAWPFLVAWQKALRHH